MGQHVHGRRTFGAYGNEHRGNATHPVGSCIAHAPLFTDFEVVCWREGPSELAARGVAHFQRAARAIVAGAHGRTVIQPQGVALALGNRPEAHDHRLLLAGRDGEDARAQQALSHPLHECGITLTSHDLLVDRPRAVGAHGLARDHLAVNREREILERRTCRQRQQVVGLPHHIAAIHEVLGDLVANDATVNGQHRTARRAHDACGTDAGRPCVAGRAVDDAGRGGRSVNAINLWCGGCRKRQAECQGKHEATHDLLPVLVTGETSAAGFLAHRHCFPVHHWRFFTTDLAFFTSEHTENCLEGHGVRQPLWETANATLMQRGVMSLSPGFAVLRGPQPFSVSSVVIKVQWSSEVKKACSAVKMVRRGGRDSAIPRDSDSGCPSVPSPARRAAAGPPG